MTRPWTIAGVGEILWDRFPDGDKFGGAPANFAGSAAQVASDRAQVYVVSGVGQDDLGCEALERLAQRDVDTSCVAQLDQPTGTVDVSVGPTGSASYEFASDTAWDNLTWLNEFAELAPQCDAICFGTLGQRSQQSRETFRRFIRETPAECLRIFDINLREPYFNDEVILASLELANVLKLNDEELPVVARLGNLEGSQESLLRQLAARYELNCIALTCGADGAILLRGDELNKAPGRPTEVTDTVGAGDAFTAALAVGLLDEAPLDQINDHATSLAAYVCSQAGGAPAIPAELRSRQ